MGDQEAAILRRELGRVVERRGRCFSAALKQRVAEWIVKRRSAGATVTEVAAELGLAQGTVLRWSGEHKTRRALVPVEVVPEQHAERVLSVVSPAGFRVDGLSLVEAAALLRALG